MPKIEQYKQHQPWAIQIELVEGCNLRCNFCGLNGIRGKDNSLKFMDFSVANALVNDLVDNEWNSRLEFAMHGEPTLNPNGLEIVTAFRNALPKHHMMMTSNGGGLLKDPTKLIDGYLASLNVLALDWYEGVKIIPKLLELYKGSHAVAYYPQDAKANPHRRRKGKDHDLVIVQDIAKATKGTHSTLNNHAGCGSPKNNRAKGKRCAKPFREMSIRWDGNVAICCNDWRGYYKCGNILEQTLEEIWNGPAFVAARKKLYYGERDFGPCSGCDATSYRTGLLPDAMGKETLPRVNARDLLAIEEALAGSPYTKPVLRQWELPMAPVKR